jgi:PEP-CTERM motif-containing protein
VKLKNCAALALWMAFGVSFAHAGILTISAIYDSTISNDPNHVAIEGAIGTAITTIENDFTNPITVSIYFQEGGGLGQSNFFVYDKTYTSFYSGLVANNSNPAAIAALQAAGYTTVNPVGGTNNIELKSANARAVGINQAAGCNVTPTGAGTLNGNVPNNCYDGQTGTPSGTIVDGIISLNTMITTPGSNGSSLSYNLTSTAEHEIDEILGLGSALENCETGAGGQTAACNSGTVTRQNDTTFGVGAPEDLYRYTAAAGGALANLTVNCSSPGSAYFAYGANTGALAQFNNACNGGDFGDWAGAGQVQDAFVSSGPGPAYGPNEIAALSAIGYNTSVPEPGTITLFGSGFGLLAAIGWRRTRGTQA